MKSTLALTVSCIVCCSFLVAQSPEPSASPSAAASPIPAKHDAPAAPSPAPAPTLRALVDALPQTDLNETVILLKSRYLNPAALDDKEMARATIEGLITRLGPGVSLSPPPASLPGDANPLYSEILQEQTGYLRPGTLSGDTPGKMDAVLKNFAEKGINSIILDLRATPESGDYACAAEILKRFASRGAALFSIGKSAAKQAQNFTSDQEPEFHGIMAVLVDHDNAGASEVIAAVLRAQLNALVIGETTRGEAVEYAQFPLHDGMILRVAEAEVILPEKSLIFPAGVKPDLVVRLSGNLKREIFNQSLEKGISQFVFQPEHRRMNEAALVAGVNPELDELEAAQTKKTQPKSLPYDTVIQRAVDFITTATVYGEGNR